MDHRTFNAHRDLWVREDERFDAPLARLTEAERDLYETLRNDRLGDRIRLEQERIGFNWFNCALDALPPV
jgi:hypothetical protein